MPVLSLSYFGPSNILLDDPEMMDVPLQMVARSEGCLGYACAFYVLFTSKPTMLF